MNETALDSLFGPGSIDIVGASPNATYSGNLVETLLEYGFTGGLYLVNPSREEAWRRSCYDSINDVPTVVDFVIVSVPRQYVVETVRSAGERGVPAALVITAGFGEADKTGRDLEAEISDAETETGIRVYRPNTIGVASGHHGTVATSTYSRPLKEGSLGLVSQSGALAFITFFERAADEDVDFGYVVATGNEADLTLSEYVSYLAEQEHADAFDIRTDGIDDPTAFMDAAEDAVRSGTPVIAIKVGRSDSAAAAALSHMGSVTGNDAAWDAAFDPLASDRVCIASTSSGLSSLLADMAVERNLKISLLKSDTERSLLDMEELLTFDNHRNPIDIRGYGAEIPTDIADILLNDEGYDACVFALGLPAVDERAEQIVKQVEVITEQADAPVFVLWTGRKERLDRPDPQPYERLRETIQAYYDPGACMDALASLVRFGVARDRLSAEPTRATLVNAD